MHTTPTTCQHQPTCPSAGHVSPLAARTAVAHPEQGWSLLCNGVIVFDDGGYLLPTTTTTAPAPVPVAA